MDDKFVELVSCCKVNATKTHEECTEEIAVCRHKNRVLLPYAWEI